MERPSYNIVAKTAKSSKMLEKNETADFKHFEEDKEPYNNNNSSGIQLSNTDLYKNQIKEDSDGDNVLQIEDLNDTNADIELSDEEESIDFSYQPILWHHHDKNESLNASQRLKKDYGSCISKSGMREF